MTMTWCRGAVLTALLAMLPSLAAADVPTARVGQPAPDFTATDSHGKTVHLSEFKGKPVVLEWHNQGCPFVQKHYRSGNMQRLQSSLTSDGAVWLTIISSAPGKQGGVSADDANAYVAEQKASPTDVLLDPDGAVGRLYGAKTTPHMFLVDAKGTLVYAGAIDDKPTTDVADVAGANNYVEAAYREVKAGKPVTTSATAPYGCSVKYGTP
jgi:peroxiredoxin